MLRSNRSLHRAVLLLVLGPEVTAQLHPDFFASGEYNEVAIVVVIGNSFVIRVEQL